MGHSMPLIYLFFAFISEQCYYKSFQWLDSYPGSMVVQQQCFVFYNGLIPTPSSCSNRTFFVTKKGWFTRCAFDACWCFGWLWCGKIVNVPSLWKCNCLPKPHVSNTHCVNQPQYSIRSRYSNPQHLGLESPPITPRPGLPHPDSSFV